METIQYDDSQLEDDFDFSSARLFEEGRQQKRHHIRRGIEDYFERQSLDRLEEWYDFD